MVGSSRLDFMADGNVNPLQGSLQLHAYLLRECPRPSTQESGRSLQYLTEDVGVK